MWNECIGKVKLVYEPGNSSPIPYTKINEDVKKQLNNIYQTNDISESNNIFTVSIDLKSAIMSLENLRWMRNGVEVDINNLKELCDCDNYVTPTPPQTTSSSEKECSEDDIQCIEPSITTTAATIKFSTASTKSSTFPSSTKKFTTTKSPVDVCMNDGLSRDQSCILDNTIYNILNNYYNNNQIFWKPTKAEIFKAALVHAIPSI